MKPRIFECKRCGHQWLSRDRQTPPKACARCKSVYWDRLPNQKIAIRALIQRVVYRAINEGRLVQAKACEICGAENPVAHHDSYLETDWLKVRWLCRPCHSRFHRQHPEIRIVPPPC